MALQRVLRQAFNRGRISRLGLGRTDVKRAELSAEVQTNWVPRVLGSMMLRPGWKYLSSTLNDNQAINIPFVKSTDDTALIEFTNTNMRVRVNDTVISRPAVTTAITDGTFDGTDAISNVTVSSGAPAAAQLASAFSRDGLFFATGQVLTPFVKLWSVSGTTFTALSNPASLPTGQVNGITFNKAGTFMALAIEVSPYVELYAISGSTFTKQSNPASLPTGAGKGVSFSDDGAYLAVAHTTTPFCTVYNISGSTFTKVVGGDSSQFVDAAGLPAGNGTGVSFRVGSTRLAVSHTTIPFVSIYSTNSTEFTKLANPSSLPAGNATGCAFNQNVGDGSLDLLAVSHTTIPFVTVYAISSSGSTYTKTTNTGTLPDGNGQCVAFSPNGLRLAVGHATTQFISLYRVHALDSTYFTIETNPGTLPADSVDSVCFSPLGQMMAVTTTGTPYLNVYSLQPWMDYDASGTTSQYFGGALGTRLLLAGNLFGDAKRIQGIYVPSASRNVEHAVNLTITNSNVIFRIGSVYGGEDLIGETVLGEGEHSLAFTPGASDEFIYIQFSALVQYNAAVATIAIDGSGEMVITSPYVTADLYNIRYCQSGDVIFLACKDVQQYKIERRATNSWSLAKYLPEDGPFRDDNTTFITLTPSALTGQITLAASKPYFRDGHLGALFRLNSVGQQTDDDFTGANQFSANEIRVTGFGTQRTMTIVRAGTWSATVTLQRSLSEPGAWVDVATFTTNGTATYNDALDNQIVYYRIGIKTGDYTSGTADINIDYASGGITGVARISLITDNRNVFANVLSPLGSTTATESWAEGIWSTYRGWPTSVTIYEGRMVWAGMDRVILSESDNYENFDDTVEGDSGPIIRTIGEGPVDNIHWLLPVHRLIAGAEGSELSIHANSFDETLTPDNFNMKSVSTQGSAPVGVVKIDNNGVFIDRTTTRVYQIIYNFDTADYATGDLTRLVPEMCEDGVLKIAVQRKPDTRVHCIKDDGTVALLIFEPDEDVTCWIDITTDGEIEDVAVLPSTPEDAVYYVVKRTINGQTKRYLERWAIEDDCVGATLNKQADSFILYSGGSTTTITGLTHLEGETVVVWGNGVYLGTYVVTSGQITGLTSAVTSAVVGLAYTAQYKSCKLAYAAEQGTALNARKAIAGLGIIAADMHYQGLEYGDSFTYLRPLPSVYKGADVVANTVHLEYDDDLVPINRNWSTDTRLCLQATAPKPCTVLALTMAIDTNG